MIGSFGEVVFEVSADKVLTPTEISRTTASRWTNHEVLGKKPVSEFVGPGLDTVSLTLILNAYLGVNVKQTMDKLLDYCRTGEAHTLVIGDVIGVDRWKITTVTQNWAHLDGAGHVISGSVDATFEEYVTTAWG